MLGVESLIEMQSDLEVIKSFLGPYLVWTISLIVVYVTGSVLRILPPDTPDVWSLWGVKVRDSESRIDWPDRFPYQSLPKYLKSRGLHGLAALVPWDQNSDCDGELSTLRSKTFLHFIKMYFALYNPRLANNLARQKRSFAFFRCVLCRFFSVFQY